MEAHITENHNTSFIPLRASDLDEVLAMMKEYYAFDGLTFENARARMALEESLGDPTAGEVWRILSGAAVAGYLILGFGFSAEFGGRIAVLDELFVLPQFRGKGLGSAALAFAENTVRARGIDTLRLEVTQGNSKARQVYLRKGFEQHNRFIMSRTSLLKE